MLNWPTIDEMLVAPLEVKRSDPFYHTLQFPRFMRRKVLLSENYDKQKDKVHFPATSNTHRRTVSETSPSQALFTAYGRVSELVKSLQEKNLLHKDSKLFDEAVSSQEYFTKIPPNDVSLGEYKYSLYPREITAEPGNRKRKEHKKFKSYGKIPHKITANVDNKLLELATSNVSVILTKSSYVKCSVCGDTICKCAPIDGEMPRNYLQNLEKGKALLEIAKREKKSKPKIVISRPKKRLFSQRKSLDEEIIRYTARTVKVKDSNIIEGSSITLHKKSRRNSS